MTTFEFDVSQKEQDGALAIFKVNNFILRLLRKRMKEDGITKSKLAEILEVERSTVSRMLSGNKNLTSRSIGEICGALGFEFDLIEKDLKPHGTNIPQPFQKSKLDVAIVSNAVKTSSRGSVIMSSSSSGTATSRVRTSNTKNVNIELSDA